MTRGSVWESDVNSPDWQCDTPQCGKPHVHNRKKCSACVSERRRAIRRIKNSSEDYEPTVIKPAELPPEVDTKRRPTCYAHKTLNKWKISESMDQRYFKK